MKYVYQPSSGATKEAVQKVYQDACIRHHNAHRDGDIHGRAMWRALTEALYKSHPEAVDELRAALRAPPIPEPLPAVHSPHD